MRIFYNAEQIKLLRHQIAKLFDAMHYMQDGADADELHYQLRQLSLMVKRIQREKRDPPLNAQARLAKWKEVDPKRWRKVGS